LGRDTSQDGEVLRLQADGKGTSELRDEEEGSQAEGGAGHSAAEAGQVVLGAMSDLFDEPMESQTRQEPGSSGGGEAGNAAAEVLVAEAGDVELALKDQLENVAVVVGEKVEASVGALALSCGLGDAIEAGDSGAGIIEGGKEFEVTTIGGGHGLAQGVQAVDRALHGSKLHLGRAILAFYPSVVAEIGDVVADRLDPEDQGELVVHLDGRPTHVVSDTGALDTGLEVVADFVGRPVSQLASEKGSDIAGFDGMHGSSDQVVVDRCQVCLAVEDDVCGVFDLHEGPVVLGTEMPSDGTEAPDEFAQATMQVVDAQGVGKLLGRRPISNLDEGVVPQVVGDAFLTESGGEHAVPVAVELQAEGRPGGDPEVAQAQVGVDEVEVVVQALRFLPAQEGLSARLVVPGAELRTRLDDGEDVDDARLRASLGQDVLDPLFLPILRGLLMYSIVRPLCCASVSALARISSLRGRAHWLTSKTRIPLPARCLVMPSGWQMSGNVPVSTIRSKHESTPRIFDA